MDNFNLKNFINENNLGAYSKLEGKKRDVDGDGDIDSDDYMAAKDAAIKKAMAKDKKEGVSENRFLAASMEDLEQVIRNLAHTGEMSEDEALEMAINKLQNMLDGRDDLDENLEEADLTSSLPEIMAEFLLLLAAGKTALEATKALADENGDINFNRIIQKFREKGGDQDDIDNEKLRENTPPKPSRNFDKQAKRSYDEIAGGIIKDLVYLREYLENEGVDSETMRLFKKADMAFMDFDEAMAYGSQSRGGRSPGQLEEGIDYDKDEMERKGFDLYPGGRNEAWRYATEELGIPADEILGKLSDDTVYDAIYHSMQIMGMLGDDDLDEDIDVGHQDDEPNMLKKKMYRTAKMAAMIYKELDKFDQFPTEVDFPNWWQAKLIKANDYLNSAFDYLDGEQQTAKLDAMAEKKIEVDDDTDFKVKLSHLLDKHVDN